MYVTVSPLYFPKFIQVVLHVLHILHLVLKSFLITCFAFKVALKLLESVFVSIGFVVVSA